MAFRVSSHLFTSGDPPVCGGGVVGCGPVWCGGGVVRCGVVGVRERK